VGWAISLHDRSRRFLVGIVHQSPQLPGGRHPFPTFPTFDKAAVALGIGGALAGQGKGRWLIVLSGFGVGASWLWFAVLQ